MQQTREVNLLTEQIHLAYISVKRTTYQIFVFCTITGGALKLLINSYLSHGIFYKHFVSTYSKLYAGEGEGSLKLFHLGILKIH